MTAGNLTTPRGDFTTAIIGDYYYVFGGDSGGGAYLSSIERARISGNGTLGAFADAGVQLTAARSGAVATVAGNFVYVIGGVANFRYKDSIERAAINSDGTLGLFSDTGQTLVAKRAYPSAIRLGSTLYVVGGFDGSAARTDSEALSFTATSIAGINAAAPALAVGRSGQSTELIGNAALVIGGYGSSYLGDVERAETLQALMIGNGAASTSTLKYSANAPAAAVIGNNLYLFGGADSTGTSTKNVQRGVIGRDGSVGAFADAGVALGTARVGANAATIGKYVYVIGGDVSSIERAAINPDGSIGAFSNAAVALSAARRSATVAVIGETLFVVAGKVAGNAVATTEQSSIDANGNLGAFAAGPSLATARSQHSMALVGSRVWIIGGTTDGTAPIATTEVGTYSGGALGSFSNAAATTVTTPRFGALLFNVGPTLYLSGGSNASGAITGKGFEISGVDAAGNVGGFTASNSTVAAPRTNAAGAVLENQVLGAGGAPTSSGLTLDVATLQ